MSFMQWASRQRLRKTAVGYRVAEAAWMDGFQEGTHTAFVEIWRKQAEAREQERTVKQMDIEWRAAERLLEKP